MGTPVGENRDGRDLEGFAKVPPIAGPMIVPIDQTKGITAYARAVTKISNIPSWISTLILTLVLWLLHKLANHGLDNANVTIYTCQPLR